MKPGELVSFFKLEQQVGDGGFGDVWKVQSTENDHYYAMKIEPSTSKRRTLQFEASVLKKLNDSERFPRYVIDGSDNNIFFLVMELLGPNLSQISQALPNHHFSNEYLPRLFDDMLYSIESLHAAGIVHRDIKPQNFVVRLDGKVAICLIDFGVSHVFVNQNGSHLDARDHAVAIGSPLYASINSHDRIELSRRDDLISLLYSIMSISSYGLPWGSKPKMEDIRDMKQKTPLADVISPLGPAFVTIAKHVQELGFSDTPNYNLMHQTIQAAFPQTTAPYEWMTIPGKQSDTLVKRGCFDPTGFIMDLAPFLLVPAHGGGCLIL